MKGNLFVPPNGFAGASAQTAAVRNGISTLFGKVRRAVGRVKKKIRTGARRKARQFNTAERNTKRGRAKLVKGSAAAKAWGAKMRRLRKK
jgi:hypothetical protein